MELEKKNVTEKRVPLFDPNVRLRDLRKALRLTLVVTIALPFLLTWPALLLAGSSLNHQDIASSIVHSGYGILAVWATVTIVRHLMRLNMNFKSVVLRGLLALSIFCAFFVVSYVLSASLFLWKYGFGFRFRPFWV